LQQLLARSVSNFDLLLATEAAEFNAQYADVLQPSRLRNVAEQLSMLRDYSITLLTLKNEIVSRLQQPFAGPSIVVKREQQHALEQVVMQVRQSLRHLSTTRPFVTARAGLRPDRVGFDAHRHAAAAAAGAFITCPLFAAAAAFSKRMCRAAAAAAQCARCLQQHSQRV
jgi:hypothetical protein